MLLLPPDSPLRNPPANLHPVQKASWDAARFAFDMTHVSYVRLLSVLHEVGQMFRQQAPLAHQPTVALVDAWAVVDNLWRLHNVLRNFRGLKNSPELELHLRALATVEDLRHGIQHLHQKLNSLGKNQKHVLGTLSWVWTPEESADGGFILTIAAGAIREGNIPIPNPLGRSVQRPVGMVTLAAFQKEIDLTALVVRMVELAKGLDAGVRLAVKGASPGGADPVMALEFHVGENASGKQDPVTDQHQKGSATTDAS